MCDILKEIKGLEPEQLLKKYNISRKPPINLPDLIKGIGISSYPFNFAKAEAAGGYDRGSIVGAAISNGNNLDILYAQDLSDEEARETVAHELGHCCCHADDLEMEHIELKTVNIPGYDDEKEKCAEGFAKELLIPKKSLEYVYGLLDNPSVSSLAKIFQVSNKMMESRLKDLGWDFLIDDTFYNIQPI